MLDPVTLGIPLGIVAVIIALIFYLTSGGDGFDQAYDENIRKLLVDDKERDKTKQKSKGNKKKDHKEKKDKENAKANSDAERESPIPNEPVHQPTPTKKEEEPKKTEEHKAPAEPKMKQQDKKADKKNKEDEVSAETIVFEEVGKKKKKSKMVEEPKVEQSKAAKTEAVKEKSKDKKSPQKPKGTDVVVVPQLDGDKVLARLATQPDLESEYISFLVQYFHDNSKLVSSLESTVSSLRDQEAESRKKVELHQTARLSAEKQLKNQEKVAEDLQSKLKALNSAEAATKQQIAQLAELRSQNETLRTTLTDTTQRTQAEMEYLKADRKTLADQITKMQDDLARQHKQNNELQSLLMDTEKKASQIDQLYLELETTKAEFIVLDTVARQNKTELDEKTTRLETLEMQRSSADENQRRALESDELLKQFHTEKNEWKEKEARLMEEYLSMQTLVQELHKEVAKFETFKREQDALNNTLAAREERLQAAEQALSQGNGRIKAMEEENSELRAHVEDLKRQLAEASSHSQTGTDAQENNDDEIVILKKTATLDAAPTAVVGDADSQKVVEELREANRRLQDRNDELRERNFAILDKVKASEHLINGNAPSVSASGANHEKELSKVEDERTLVAKKVSSVVKMKALKKNANKQEFESWLDEFVTSLKSLKTQTAAPAKAGGSDVEKQLEQYRNALGAVSKQLCEIENVSAEKVQAYEQRIQRLEQQLSKACSVLASTTRLNKELKECDTLRKQIATLRTSLTDQSTRSSTAVSPAAATAASGPSPSAPRSDDSDWEVVSTE